jgi:amino acid transporter
MQTGSGAGQLTKALTTPKIVFLVIAAAAPLAAMVGTVPLAFAIGDGPGFPAMFVFAGLTLALFSVGYAAMSRQIVNAGGFYTYLSCGLGKPVAVAGGLVAVIAYNAVTVGLAGAFGYFARLIGQAHGLTLPWEDYAAVAVLAMAVLGYRQIDLSARVLAILMAAEIGILAVLDVAIMVDRGTAALPTTSFHPSTVLASGVGISAMFAFISYIGFESAALYGEESRNPRRSVPLATYLSVGVITVFYALTSWVAVGAIGADQVQQVAGQQLGDLFFGLSGAELGNAATTVMQIMLCTSLFAATLALHNASNRYMFALGRERVLPGWLGGVHLRHGAPHRASIAQTGITVVLLAAFAIAGLDPYLNLATSMLGLGTLGIIALQAAAAVSVVAFFRNRPDRHWWRTVLAPLLGFAGLVTASVLVVRNFAVMTGSTTFAVTALPWLLLLAAAAGFGYALWIRSARQERYAGLASVLVRSGPPPAGAEPIPLAAASDAA